MQILLNIYETAWLLVAGLALRKCSVIFTFSYFIYLRVHSFSLDSKHFACCVVTHIREVFTESSYFLAREIARNALFSTE